MSELVMTTSFQPEGPQPLLREIPQGKPYPTEALGPLRNIVEAVQAMTLAPIAIVAQSALSAVSLAVQGFANVETLGGRSPTSLYCLTVARSGERKSTCDKLIMGAFHNFEREKSEEYRQAHQKWQIEVDQYEAEKKRIQRDATSSKSDKRLEAEVDLSALGAAPEAPCRPDRTVTEPTFEGLTRLYVEGQPSLGIFSDEGGQMLGGHAMNADNKQKTISAFSGLWSGDPVKRTRASEGQITLYERRLAIHLMVQPIIARSLLSDALVSGQGFLARFLITEPPSTIGVRLQSNVVRNDAALNIFNEQLEKILRTEMPIECLGGALRPRLLPLSLDARELLSHFADTIELQQAKGEKFRHVTSYASKCADQAARIAGVLTLFDNLAAAEVSTEAMNWGCKLAQFYLEEAARLADGATVSLEIERAESLRRWLVESWEFDDVTPREVMQFGPGALRESPKTRAALGILEQHGWLVRLDSGTAVRGVARKEAYRIVRLTEVA